VGHRSRGSKNPKGPDTPDWALTLKAGTTTWATAGLGMMTESITWITPREEMDLGIDRSVVYVRGVCHRGG
jgi:hypothetical protein